MNIFQGTLRVESIETVARDTKKFRFSVTNAQTLVPSDEKFEYKPGQFLSLKFSDTAWRAYSMASNPSDELIEFVVRYVPNGTASDVFWKTKVGDTFEFKGPFGELCLSETEDAHLVFCATGTGIAPFRSMILEEVKKKSPRKMTLLYGGRNAEDISYLDEMSNWSDQLEVKLGLSREESTNINLPWKPCRITTFLEEENWGENAEFYICGSGSMVKSVNELLEAKNIEKEKIFMERFN
jgi:ferredoxin-NADP reductase